MILNKNSNFQNNIQQNKDWNPFILHNCVIYFNFQNNIQQNKDWNPEQKTFVCMAFLLSE